MSEYASLHATSLLLVGRQAKKPNSAGATEHLEAEVSADMRQPDNQHPYKNKNETQTASDSGIETIMQSTAPQQQRQQQDVLVLPAADDLGPDESRWRAHGKAHRRKLLENDYRTGGRNFTMSFDCSVQRYFSVAHWALEQFHQLYQNNTENIKELEELFLMGNRIISFLTECLPKHPGMRKAPYVRQRSKKELDLLRKCLEDVALRIDEHVCNQFVEDGDMFLDSMLAAQMDDDDSDDDVEAPVTPKRNVTSSGSKSPKMVHLEDWDLDFPDDEFEPLKGPSSARQQERSSAESPTAETVGTTGSDSLEPSETSYQNCESPNKSKEKTKATEDEDNFPEDDEFSLVSENVSVFKGVRLDFLRAIACEPVLYETDSEAADSWANTIDDNSVRSRPCLPSSSGVTPTYDPARIAFRDLMNKLPHKSILQRSSRHYSPSASPKFSDIMEERDTSREIDHANFDEIIEKEIKEYLDSSQTEEDPTQFVESWHEKISTQKNKGNVIHRPRRQRNGQSSVSSYISSSSSSAGSSTSTSSSSLPSLSDRKGSQNSAFSSFHKTKKPERSSSKQQRATVSQDFLAEDDWTSFDSSAGKSFFADSSF